MSETVAPGSIDDGLPHVGRNEACACRVRIRRDHREPIARVNAACHARIAKRVRQPLGIATRCAARAYERLRDDAAKDVQRTRSEAAHVETHALEPGAANRARDREHRVLGRPLVEQSRTDLDTREVIVISNAQIASHTELAKRTLGALDPSQALDGDRGAVREAR